MRPGSAPSTPASAAPAAARSPRNATGNVATEDLVYLFDRMGVSTGLDLATTTATTAWLEERLGKRLPGALLRAGGFPAPPR